MPYSEIPTQNDYRPPVRRRRRRRRRLKKHYRVLLALLCVALVLWMGSALASLFSSGSADTPTEPEQPDVSAVEPQPSVGEPVETVEEPEEPAYTLATTADTVQLDDSLPSEYAVLIDMETGAVLAEKNSETIINPASMTKILTLLVATEQITDTGGTFTMTREIADYCFSNECSVVGYEVGEEIPVEELFYGCILCSGADACLGLAQLAAGSHEAFVERMNQKVEELGLSETTHFTNCVGLYDEEHYCTIRDMALLLKAALENERCKTVLSTPVYMSVPTPEHPEGQVLSNWFVRRIEEQDTGGITVLCAKTGYVPESGNCAASYGEDREGKGYLCVTGKAYSSKQAVYDHASLYKTCAPEETEAF